MSLLSTNLTYLFPSPLPHLSPDLQPDSTVLVPQNVAGLERLRRFYLVDNAVIDMLAFSVHAGGHVIDAASAPLNFKESAKDTEIGDEKKTANGDGANSANCEPLVVACGAHLHWHLSRVSTRYRFERAGNGDGLTRAKKAEGAVEIDGRANANCWDGSPTTFDGHLETQGSGWDSPSASYTSSAGVLPEYEKFQRMLNMTGRKVRTTLDRGEVLLFP